MRLPRGGAYCRLIVFCMGVQGTCGYRYRRIGEGTLRLYGDNAGNHGCPAYKRGRVFLLREIRRDAGAVGFAGDVVLAGHVKRMDWKRAVWQWRCGESSGGGYTGDFRTDVHPRSGRNRHVGPACGCVRVSASDGSGIDVGAAGAYGRRRGWLASVLLETSLPYFGYTLP